MADVATLLVKVTSDVKSATSGLDEVTSRSDKMKQGLSTAAKAATGVLLGLGAAAVVAGKAAADDAQGQALLANSLAKTTGANKDAVAGVEDFISAMSLATGVADDQLRPAMATLARATGDVQTSQAAAMDVAAATGTDVESVSKAIAKGYAGQTTAIGRLVPGLDAATLASGDMSAVMDELQAKTGGSAAAAADTTAGQMAKMTVAMDEAKESIGAGLLPVMSKFATALATVAAFAGAHPKLFQAIAIAVAAVAAAIIILNIAVGVYSSVMTIAGAVAGTAWLSILGPILLVIAAIALVGVAVFLIIKHWDAIKAAAVSAWETIRSTVLAVTGAVQTAVLATWTAIQAGVSALVGWIKSNWPKLLAILTGPIGIAVGLIVKNWDTVKSAANTVFAAVKTAVGWVSSAIDTLVGWIKKIDFPDMAKPFNVAKTAIGHVSDAIDTMVGWVKKIAIPAMSGPFDTLKTAVSGVSGAIETLIGWIGKIHFPKIPKGLSSVLPGGRSAAVPAPAVAAYGAPRVSMASVRASTGSSGGITVNVTGAIDPEATARQIRRILAGHDRRVGLAT